MRDGSPQGDQERAKAFDKPSSHFAMARLGLPLVGSVLIVVLAMVAIGAAGVLSAGGRADGVVAAVHVASSSSGPAAAALADVYVLDLRTRKTTDLPSSLRAVHNASHFRMSPDGSMVAFDDWHTIYVATIDGSYIRQFTPDGGVSAPNWSPDGRTIVFSEGDTIFLLKVATGDIAPVMRDKTSLIWFPNFSADGRTILYTTVRRRRLTLRTVPATGGRSAFLMRGAFGTYSPDGTTIAYRTSGYDGLDITQITSGALWLADADGSDPRRVGHTTGGMSQTDPEALWPAWSPDGTRVAYQPMVTSAVRVLDVRLSRRRTSGAVACDPSWFDDHMLIVASYRTGYR